MIFIQEQIQTAVHCVGGPLKYSYKNLKKKIKNKKRTLFLLNFLSQLSVHHSKTKQNKNPSFSHNLLGIQVKDILKEIS